ncbi:MAG: hypothetical protein R3A12_04285 [Ignavibacteria bacterium]
MKIFKDKLPSSVTGNHLKIGFMTPFDNWMEEAERKILLLEFLNSDSFNNKKILIPEKIRYIFNNKNIRNFLTGGSLIWSCGHRYTELIIYDNNFSKNITSLPDRVFRKFTDKFKGTMVLYGQPHKNRSLKNDDLKDDGTFRKVKNNYFTKSGNIFISKIFRIILDSKPEVIISVFNTGNLNIYILFY